jgi:hypothetical protein
VTFSDMGVDTVRRESAHKWERGGTNISPHIIPWVLHWTNESAHMVILKAPFNLWVGTKGQSQCAIQIINPCHNCSLEVSCVISLSVVWPFA